MKNNYLYWLGAGASALALPLVATFDEALRGFRKKLNVTTFNGSSNSGQTVFDLPRIKDRLLESIDWLLENLAIHTSVDTFAKKLYFKRDRRNLNILKAVLSCFFVAEQSTKPVDYRYDSFFASILRFDGFGPVEIPDDIKFLLWNYDLQLEKAYFGYTGDNTKVIEDLTLNRKLHHLNGYCGTTQPDHIGKEFTEAFQVKKEMSNLILELFSEYDQDGGAEPDIDFAWEMNDNFFNNSIGPVTEDIREIVVIGYSFPFFNRKIDKKIFTRLEKVEKIYLQSPVDSLAGIKERMLAISPNLPEPTLIQDTSQFYIPFDYDLQ